MKKPHHTYVTHGPGFIRVIYAKICSNHQASLGIHGNRCIPHVPVVDTLHDKFHETLIAIIQIHSAIGVEPGYRKPGFTAVSVHSGHLDRRARELSWQAEGLLLAFV